MGELSILVSKMLGTYTDWEWVEPLGIVYERLLAIEPHLLVLR
jgi:hypothetical protein